MIRSGHGARSLLAGLAAGAIVVGVLVAVTPTESMPAALRTALGDPAPAGPVAAAPTTAVPTTRVRVPLPVVVLPTAAAPTTAPPTTSAVPTTSATPTTTTTSPATTSARAVDTGPVQGVIDATNAERADAGCDPVRADPRLTAAAQGHSTDMAEHDYFSHTGRDGSGFDDRIRAEGHPSPGGENIAMGQDSAAEAVTAWMNSPGHRRNILDCSFTTIGVGLDERGDYWTQDFGR